MLSILAVIWVVRKMKIYGMARRSWPKFRWETAPGNMPMNAQNFSCPRPLPGLHPARSGQASGSLTASEVATIILVAKLVTRCLRKRLPARSAQVAFLAAKNMLSKGRVGKSLSRRGLNIGHQATPPYQPHAFLITPFQQTCLPFNQLLLCSKSWTKHLVRSV
jgi:hypothetical protein